MSNESLSAEILYSGLQGHIGYDNDRLWQVRTWAIGLGGAVHTIALPLLLTSNEASAVIATVTAASFLNALFGVLGRTIAHGVFRIGAYLKHLERESGLLYGWEHFVAHRRRTRRGIALSARPFKVLATEPLVWLAWSYVGALGLLSDATNISLWWTGFVVTGVTAVAISVGTLTLENGRDQAEADVSNFFNF